MLGQKNLFEKNNKVDNAIERLQMLQPPEGYYLAFSGGKDSIVLKKLADMAGIKYDAHYNVTTIDPPELVKFIKTYHKNVIFDKPKQSFLKELTKRGFPTRVSRWCCEYLKEKGGSGRKVLTGIRWSESNNRGKRRMVETCYKDKTKTIINPIIDWEESDIWEFINKEKIPYCELYDNGFKRIGCLFCPMTSTKIRQKQVTMYPKFTTLFIKHFEILHSINKPSMKRWKNGREMFYWWISEVRQNNEQEGQLHLFP